MAQWTKQLLGSVRTCVRILNYIEIRVLWQVSVTPCGGWDRVKTGSLGLTGQPAKSKWLDPG